MYLQNPLLMCTVVCLCRIVSELLVYLFLLWWLFFTSVVVVVVTFVVVVVVTFVVVVVVTFVVVVVVIFVVVGFFPLIHEVCAHTHFVYCMTSYVVVSL